MNIEIFKNNMTIEYPYGDTFSFAITEDNAIDTARRLRLQISPNGNPKTLILEKTFYPEGNAFVVMLTEEEARKLELNKMYEYRLTYLEADGSVMTTFSGIIYVQWGAPGDAGLHTPSAPAIHIGRLTAEKRMDNHCSAPILDHPDGSVTEEKLSTELREFLSSMKGFDGVIEADANDESNAYDSYTEGGIYAINYAATGGTGCGILLVQSESSGAEYACHQTKIDAKGNIQIRTWDTFSGWSEWQNAYITDTDFATNSPGSGQQGKPGIIRLGHMQGLTISNENTLMLEAASVNDVKKKYSSLMPVPPALMAYAVALATHQGLGGDYSTESIAVVHENKPQELYFPGLTKDQLPVSYRAVADELKNYHRKGSDNAETEIYLKSPNGSIYSISVKDDGTLNIQPELVFEDEIEFE